ncbi:replication initiation factor domain-containing protein [Psychrobacter urativorans]|uniref:replication initiation factor domain-containing protein n=1 Tax=Psychrobacter urativorans TaxID=45610 RepID=UPI0019197DD1|nr:replication initiation factor domain-containing protein [Psychrobacter urativorans]
MSIQNDYPTVKPSEFKDLAGKKVDTLINNMRVNLERCPRAKAQWIAERQKVRGEALSTTETIVISGRKPKVQTIRQPINGQVAMIDWLNVTFDVATLGEKFRRTNEDDDEYMALCQAAVAEMSEMLTKIFGKKYGVINQRQNGANFYKYSFDFGENYGKICIGGQRDSVLIMLNGTGCSLAPVGWEKYMHEFLTTIAKKPKISRIDLAHDDLNGDYLDIHVLDQMETDQLFHCGGARHDVGQLGNWKHGDPNNKGLTLNLGVRESGKFTRFYEKGKKSGDKDGKYSRWVRAEVEFKANDRVIPFDVLLDPSSYFMGAYPVFADLFDYERINKLEIIQKSAQITLQHSFDWLKTQAGKYFSFYSTFMSPEEIIEMIKSDDPDDVPVRLHLPYAFAIQQALLGNVLFSENREVYNANHTNAA